MSNDVNLSLYYQDENQMETYKQTEGRPLSADLQTCINLVVMLEEHPPPYFSSKIKKTTTHTYKQD